MSKANREPTRADIAIKDTKEFLGDFNPQTSTRERRKLTRAGLYRICRSVCCRTASCFIAASCQFYCKTCVLLRSTITNALHDRDGKMIDEGADLCDCLEPECPGCHFPCHKCGSLKCSIDCRKNRKWTPDIIELEGTGKTLTLEAALNSFKEKQARQWEDKVNNTRPIAQDMEFS